MPSKKQSKKSASRRQGKKRLFVRKALKPKVIKPPSIKKMPAKALSKAGQRDVRNTRRAFVTLKKLGLTKDKRRSSQIKASDKKTAGLIRRFRDVLTGRSEVVQLPKGEISKYKKSGRRIVGDKVILKKEPGVTRERKGKRVLSVKEIEGGRIITLAFPNSRNDLNKTIRELERDPEIQRLIKLGWRYAFRYYGHFSYAVFQDLDLLKEYLEHYKSLDETMRRQMMQIELVLIERDFERPELHRPKRVSKERARTYKSRFRSRMARRNPDRWAQLKKEDAARKRRERAQMSKTARAQYNRASRERAKRSWNKRKPKR